MSEIQPQQPLHNQPPAAPPGAKPPRAARGAALYPDTYVWFILFASMDVMLTWIILHEGGSELNAIADWIIWHFDLYGVVAYKFLLVVVVVAICEYIGRRNPVRGRKLAQWAVMISLFPVVVGATQLLTRALGAMAN